MSSTPERLAAPEPRVREQAREAAALMAFSLLTAAAVTVVLLLLAQLGR